MCQLSPKADTAQRYASAFGASLLARYAGLLHDIGKYDAAFQQYLFDKDAMDKLDDLFKG